MRCEKARKFILENARPLELALFNYFFDNGPKDNVIMELEKYQNTDGGFGHGLEADNWNPNSNPVATNDAIITLYRIGALDNTSEMVQEIIRYLSSHVSFNKDRKRWLFAIDSNKDYPHAIWWEKGESDGIHGFNPTVSLAAFMVCFGNSKEYYAQIVRDAFSYLQNADDIGGDALKCFLLSYELFYENNIRNVIDLNATYSVLSKKIGSAICKDPEKYGVEYVPVPSDFFAGMYERFITKEIQGLIDIECKTLEKLQKTDGGFDISWQWYNNYSEFEQARNWWRPKITIDKLLFSKR
ncbi:hypothetical protein [Novisyntrophococcus fermenticellae]|uniref:hypothetical protein n=1 Tax=Novisyntrophococcus fermenticellae TaxID=2068655 RepID=UPI001E290288|nr:hypothetical protein [Novisyntrophococcus fermenticellae]